MDRSSPSKSARTNGSVVLALVAMVASAIVLGLPTAAMAQDEPSIAVSDVTVTEGNSGTVDAVFMVSLTAPSDQTVSVDYASSDDTAEAGTDYFGVGPTTITFDPGVIEQTATVQVIGDMTDEADETYFIDLTSPVNAIVADGQGLGTITDDDTLPAIDSFTPGAGAVHAVVDIFGTAFSGATAITIGGTSATPFRIDSDGHIRTRVPFGALTGPVTVTTPIGTATSSTSLLVRPQVAGFSPGSGSPGTTVTILGKTFTDATSVSFGNVVAVFFVDSYTQITATVPNGAQTGRIVVRNTGGKGASKTSFVVT